MAARSRSLYLFLYLLTVVIGILSRNGMIGKGPLFHKDLGDALYAVAAYFLIAVLFPKWPSLRLGAVALTYCVAIEYFKLVPGLGAVRQTLPGKLILGTGFSYRDILMYVVGTVATTFVEREVQVFNGNPQR
jgi:hypothetical protein